MSVYNDKYSPKKLKKFGFSKVTSILLEKQKEYTEYYKKIEGSYNITNMIILGVKGSGKTSRIYAFLNEVFHDNIRKSIEIKNYSLKYKNNKYEYNVVTSKYHFEFDFSEHGTNDYYIIKDFMNKIKDTLNIYTNSHHIIVIKNLNMLSNKAQLYFRRTIELDIKTVRFIFTASKLNIESALLSRCTLIKLSSPTYKDISKILKHIIKKESPILYKNNKKNLNNMIKPIIHQTRQSFNIYNLKESIHYLQLSINKESNTLDLYINDDYKLIYQLVNLIKNNKNLTKTVHDKINNILYELYTNQYDFQLLLKNITLELEELINPNQLISMASDTSSEIAIGNHSIIPIQQFIFNIFLLK